MNKQCLLLIVLTLSAMVWGQNTVYVSEKLEVPLREKPTLSAPIKTMLPTGKKMVLLERKQEGWAKVKVDNITGWIIASYVSSNAPAFQRLDELEKKYNQINIEYTNQKQEISQLNESLKHYQSGFNELKIDNGRLSKEKEHMEQAYKDALALQHKNQTLAQENLQLKSENQLLQQENLNQDKGVNTWFFVGAIVMLVGLILGVLLTVILSKRRAHQPY